ncbi:MAG TPA: tRNA uridine-5-carboxymethylaminomethyl(34) synthesis GTPase MnmE [Caulobacteraceae bacterium]|nr:tRNA uridine-5-carboxymethylaminomethyl(34) synthesis GTPase MnmE [Caulobacteraceae bacterium]
MTDTVYALATAPGRAAIAVIRISGPDSGRALHALGAGDLRARRASVRLIKDGAGAPIDQALVIRFPGPSSYTGEDMAELHVHGGPGVIEAAVAALAGLGIRAAEPGELTRRAFQNGKLGLDQAEAIADLVDAETRAQQAQALRQLQGSIGRRYEGWRAQLTTALAQLEAAIDFADEDIPTDTASSAAAPLGAVLEQVEAALAGAGRGERIREGYRIAIIGAPNAGKSSLFNALLERDAAIVTPQAGATRDIIEATLRLGAYRAILADMAGLRRARGVVEAEGVRRARGWAGEAELRLWVVDSAASGSRWRAAADMLREGDFCLLNKADLTQGADASSAAAHAREVGAQVSSVSLTAPGNSAVDQVRCALGARIQNDVGGTDVPLVTRQRHRRILVEAKEHLSRAGARLGAPELAAEDVRLAARALSRVTGRIGAEDVLDEIFATFCIGK